MPDLPVRARRDAILGALAEGALVLSAPPGSGKSTQVPRILLEADAVPGRILVLQPRRIAARNLAQRVADELGQPLGQDIGYQVRFEARFGAGTKVLFQTYGLFFQQLVADPRLRGVGAVLFDEFHERALEADAGLAWARRLRAGPRPDLKVVAMSATLEGESLARYLGAPVLDIPARVYPVEIEHQAPAAGEPAWAQAARALRRLVARGLEGSALVFMPGAGEIRRCAEEMDPICRAHGLRLLELHGAMELEAQQRALRLPAREQCVIVATNIAETSLTIPGVRAVIDSGLARTSAYDPERDMGTLHLGPISLQNAIQRAGRAGRTGPGLALRLWSAEREKSMPASLAPEILRSDLTSLLLSLHALFAAMGGEVRPEGPRLLDWPTPPDPAHWDQALGTLLDLGAVEGAEGNRRITETGRELLRYPAHPRLAAAILRSPPGARAVTLAMIALLEGQARRKPGPSLDLYAEGLDLALHPEERRFERELREAHAQLRRLEGTRGAPPSDSPESRKAVAMAWLRAYPERVAARVEGTLSYQLPDGRKGVLAPAPGARSDPPPVILVLQLHESGGARGRQVGVPVFLPCEPAWVGEAFPGACRWERAEGWDAARGRALAEEQFRYRGLALDRRPLAGAAKPSEETEYLLVEKILSGEIPLPARDEDLAQLERRVRLAAGAFPEYGIPKLDADDWRLIYHELCHGKTSARQVQEAPLAKVLRDYVGKPLMDFVERVAPANLRLPNGRMAKYQYPEQGPPELSARLGDFLGMRGKAFICEGKVPVTYDILAPNYRTVQKTLDLDSFWKNTYPEVRKELKRRYPKHPWPEPEG